MRFEPGPPRQNALRSNTWATNTALELQFLIFVAMNDGAIVDLVITNTDQFINTQPYEVERSTKLGSFKPIMLNFNDVKY